MIHYRQVLLQLAESLDAEGLPRVAAAAPGSAVGGQRALTLGTRLWARVRGAVLEGVISALAPPPHIAQALRSGAAGITSLQLWLISEVPFLDLFWTRLLRVMFALRYSL